MTLFEPSEPPRRTPNAAARNAFAGGIGMFLMQALAEFAEMPISGIPFACSLILLVAAPQADASQPRAIIGGHLICAVCGCLAARTLGPFWLTLPLAIVTCIFLMQVAKSMHPPAGLTALIAATEDPGWLFVAEPILAGAGTLVGGAYLYFRLIHREAWPRYWFRNRTGTRILRSGEASDVRSDDS